MEPNADAAGTGVSNQLIVDPTHVYSDLDELIVNHVQAMARRVDDLMAHERFKKGPEDELRKSLCRFPVLCLIHHHRSVPQTAAGGKPEA